MAYSPAIDIPLSAFGPPTSNINMNSHKLTSLLDGSVIGDSAGWDQLPAVGNMMPYVVSGCIWTTDTGTTLACSMTSGTIVIAGLLYSVSAVTSRSFTANNDTYIDIAISGGVATITYTAVPNYQTSPALAGGGTVLNTIRVGVISAGATAVVASGIGQGGLVYLGNAGTQPSTTVAAGSNGSAINVTPLNVTSSASFKSGGGWAQVAVNSNGQTATIQYTGTAAGQLIGVTLISGTAAGTVATGGAVTGICPVAITDMLGNRIYPSTGFPGVVGGAYYTNAFTSTNTANSPVPGGAIAGVGFIAPFIIPAGAPRNLKMTISTPAFGSSAVAGTGISLRGYLGNAGNLVAFANPNVKVASDFDAVTIGALPQQVSPTAPGSYNAQMWFTQGAAGTINIGALATATVMLIELV